MDKVGDRNTKFFHATTIQRRERNRIQRLNDNSSNWRGGQKEVTQVVLNHFGAIYNSTNPQNMEEDITAIPKCGSDAKNWELCKPMTNEEIKKEIFSLDVLKALGGDGLNGLFYQKHWEEVGPDVCSAIKVFI